MKFWFDSGAWASNRAKKVISQLVPEEVRHIVVVRHAALGDMVLVRPFLKELRLFFPKSNITLSVVSNYNYGVPDDLVDQVHVMYGDDVRGVSLSQQIKRARELGEVDLFFDFADSTRSRYLSLLTNAKLKIGFPYRWYLRNLLLDAAVFRSDYEFEAVNMLHALELLGANPTFPPDFAWELGQHEKNRSSTTRPYLVYFPFASHSNKCWSIGNFNALIKQASGYFPDYDHYILQGNSAWEKLDEFSSLAAESGNVKLQSVMPLDAVTTFLRCSSLVVSNDTGIRNLAIALGTPSLGIFFKTVPYRYWPRYDLHDIVFKPNGDAPSVNDVLEHQAQMVERIRRRACLSESRE